jgi:hypothetical protein
MMANQKQAATRRLKMSERAQQQLDLHFPDITPQWLWRRKTNDGFTTLPRTLPLVMQAVDAQSKGQPAGHTLFCLWVRSPDNPLVTIENPATFASEAGFYGERAVDTWRRRMKRLHSLNLILPKRGPSGDFHYVLLLNPNIAMEHMRNRGLVQDGLYARFLDRLVEVGGYGEMEAIRALWQQEKAAALVAAASVQPTAGQAVSPNASASSTSGADPAPSAVVPTIVRKA